MTMYGADAWVLEEAAGQLRAAADELDASRGALGGLLGALHWVGNVASSFVGLWNSDYRPRLGSTAAFLRDAAAKLEFQARQQRDASDASTGSRLGLTPFPAKDRYATTHEQRRVVGLDQYYERQRDSLANDEFEIMKVSDNPPRYVVNLPGIEFGLHSLWGRDHLRDLENASRARLTGADAYAERVKYEMQRAGIPAGAEVMLVGHSAGAIAVMNIASDADFNRPGGGGSGYHVNVTHVMAAGAGLRDWIDDPPAGTQVLMAINRNDAVADMIQRGDFSSAPDLSPGSLGRRVLNDITDNVDGKVTSYGEGHTLLEFSTQAGPDGHHYDNYVKGLLGTSGYDDFERSAAKTYFSGSGGMEVVRIKVPDQINDFHGVDDVGPSLGSWA